MKAGIAAIVAAAAAWGQYPVKRLRPSAFQEMPAAVAGELTRRGCTIPQPDPKRRSNAIRGEFARRGQIDWAVLCSSGGRLSLLVFWEGAGTPAVAARWKDPGESVIFDTLLRPVGRKFIMDHYRAYGGPKPPPIDHEGIDVSTEKASAVWYFYRGKWMQLQGAD